MTQPTDPPQPYSTDELQPLDLATYTSQRLSADDPNTLMALESALWQVRNYCKWHVCPVKINDTISLDGPGQWGGLAVGIGGLYYASGSYLGGVLRHQRAGGNTLYLPSKHVTGISAVVEDGVPLDVLTDISWSDRGEIVKTSGQPWTVNLASGRNDGSQGISVTFTHGYSSEEASDWRRLVLSIADRSSLVKGLVGAFPATVGPYRVGAYFGTSRAGNMPRDAGWLDDLLGMIDTARYVRVEV